MSDGYTPIRGKCTWWRESAMDDDKYATRIKEEDKRWVCSCFVEGMGWTYKKSEIPADCSLAKHCRYWIRHF